jgi:hypothetical protein
MKQTWCTFYSIYWESRVSTCFEHYLLVFRRQKRHLVYCVRVMSVDCDTIAVLLQWCPWFSINRMKYASRWLHYADIPRCTVSKTLNIYIINFFLDDFVYHFQGKSRKQKAPLELQYRYTILRYTKNQKTKNCNLEYHEERELFKKYSWF